MPATVSLHDQLRLQTSKVDNKSRNWNLPTKTLTADLTTPEVLP
jgi:hypothetical protein